LRKKLCLKEFQVLEFTLTGKTGEMNEETETAFFDKFFDLSEAMNFGLDGVFGEDGFDLIVTTGPINTLNEERKAEFLEKLKDFPEITEFDASNML